MNLIKNRAGSGHGPIGQGRWLVLAGTVAMMLGGCAGKPYELDYSTAMDFSSLRTYEVRGVSGPSAAQSAAASLNDARVASSVESNLRARGFEPVASDADFGVSWRFADEREFERDGASLAFGYGLGTRLSSGFGLGLGVSTAPPVKEVERQKLVLEMYHPASSQVFWSAVSRQPLAKKATPVERDEEVQTLVTEMLADFPPKKE